MSTARALSWLLAMLVAAGCASSSSGPGARTATITARDIAARMANAAAPQAPQAQALLIATRDTELLAYDLAQRKLRFAVPIQAGAQAELLGDVIWVHAGDRIVALDAERGAELYRLELREDDAAPGRYAGAARSGDRIAFGVVRGAELDPTATSVIRAVHARTGELAYQRELAGYAAAPVAAQDFWLVPQQRQRLVVLDVRTGKERTRLRAASDAIDWVIAERGAVLFGGRRMHRLTTASQQPHSALTLPAVFRELPGRPEAPRSAYATRGTAASLRRVGLHLTPVPTGDDGIALLQDRVYFVFYGHVLGFDASAQLVLARRLEADVLDARVIEQGLLVITASGDMQLLSHATGETLATYTLGAALRTAQLPVTLGALQATPTGSPAAATTLHDGLLAIAQDVDSRLVPSRVLAVRELARMPDADVTRELLELYERASTPPELQSALADAIATRRTGLSHLVSALSRRYGFLEQTRPAPLTVIAPVLAAAQEQSALPALLERLRDHETPLTALPSLAKATAALGDAGTGSTLLAWLRLYRNDSSMRDAPEVLAAVASAAIHLLGEPGRRELRAMLADGRAHEQVERALAPLLATPQAVAQGSAAPSVAGGSPNPAPKAALPRTLSQRAIDAAFASRAPELRVCLDGERTRNPQLSQVRITFVAEGDGSAHAFHFAPATTQLVDCLYPHVVSLRLPAFAQERAVARVALDARPVTVASPSEPTERAAESWWSWRVRVAPPRSAPQGASKTPWWRSQQSYAQRIERAPISVESTPTPAAPAPAPASPAPAAPVPATPAPATPAPDRWWLPAQPVTPSDASGTR